MAHKIVVGTTFFSHYADSNPKWVVCKARGSDTWDCQIAEDSPDYHGTRKVFGGEEIRRSIASQVRFANMASDHEIWWNSQELGATVHYNNGFGQFVRGVIVLDKGDKKMRSTGLVGTWHPHDLPRVDATGNLIEGYHVRQIREGAIMQPNYSNMVEAVGIREGREVDPRGGEAIDITRPELTDEEKEAKRLNAIREQVLDSLQGLRQGDEPFSETLRAALQQAQKFLVGFK